MEYKPTIGLEIHVELKTRTKMFCDSLNDPDPLRLASSEAREKHPNRNVCPVCLGHPGTLPTINKKAVEAVIKTGLALGGKINPESKFDRKNYFYPDLPKGYQISQYDQPLVLGGELNGIRLRRIHLEEDTGTLVHRPNDKRIKPNNKRIFGSDSISFDDNSGEGVSLVDFNRAGVPLMELVTEPDIESAEQAVDFGKELQLILRYLDVSDADMEKGQMRVEANISLSDKRQATRLRQGFGGQASDKELGTKVEIKNLNSFRAVGEAIGFEIKRQSEILEKGEEVKQETRGWSDAGKKTITQRFKEEVHDYRYFPEPDLPPFEPTEIFDIEDMKRHLPELPAVKRERFQKEYGLSLNQAEVLVQDKFLANYFEEAASELKSQLPITNYQLLINYLTSDLLGLMNQAGIDIAELKITPEHLAHLAALIKKGELSSRMAKDILLEMFKTGSDPEDIIGEKDLAQISDEETIRQVVKEVLTENPAAVGDYKKGKETAFQFLIGKTMAKLKGQGNPEKIGKLLSEELKEV